MSDNVKQRDAGHRVVLAKAKTGMRFHPELIKQFETIPENVGKAILIENCTMHF